LRLRPKTEDEDYHRIYDALYSYETIVPGDIIVVENAVPEYAYFGELNAGLALRAGASGAIISSKTRDAVGVRSCHFPVFSSGYTCQDVRKRAVLDYYNKKIVISGVQIGLNDLVFADHEGVVVVPPNVEDRVIQAAMETLAKEKRILFDISLGKGISEVLAEHEGF
jgi:regulator of RNase E activity RraA